MGCCRTRPGRSIVGDPWVAADRTGHFYYSTLTFNDLGVGVSVAVSNNGGARWQPPVQASPAADGKLAFYSADKPALTVGSLPGRPLTDVLYDTWDDAVMTADGTFTSGLPVARSLDGGRSWRTSYADKAVVTDPNSCSFVQYIGAQPLVLANGTLLVAAERIFANDPKCAGTPVHFEQDLFTSTDGGQTFGARVKIADVTPAVASGMLDLGPGQGIRTIEFPTLAQRNGIVYAAWNDGAQGPSHIRLARSATAGRSWTLSWATGGAGVELQPALAADPAGIHLLYYQLTGGSRINVVLADTANGSTFVRHQVNTVTFPGVNNLPQFDPLIAPRLHGRLHQHHGPRRAPLPSLGRQPRHHHQLPLADRQTRPERLFRRPVTCTATTADPKIA